MSRRLGQSGDGKSTNGTTIALGITVAVVAIVALSIPVGYVMAGTIGATGTGQDQAGDAPLQMGTQGNFSVHQGGNCTAIVPVASNESVKAFYDYRTPFGENEFTNTTGNSYSSEGTTDIQEPNASVLFLHEGPTGNLSLVAVHGALNASSESGSASFTISGLPENGTWEVKDDEYDDESGFDNWSHENGNASIDWSWGENRTDGFAFGNLSDSFDVTIEPAFNENATLYGEYYNGTVANWSVVSNVSVDRSGPENVTTYNRTALNTSQDVTVTAGACGASSAAPTPPGDDGDGTAPGESGDDPIGGGAEPPAGGDDDQTEQDDDTDDGDDAGDDDADDADDDADDNGDAGDDGDADDADDGDDDDTQSPDSVVLDIDWDDTGPGDDNIPFTVTANYGDTAEDVTDEATVTSSNNSVATVDGTLIEAGVPGEVVFTANFEGQTDTESFSVVDNEPSSELEGLTISVEDDELEPDESTSVSVEAETQVGPQDVINEAEIYSEDSDVAEVEVTDVVANGAGETTITAEFRDRNASATITVTADDDTDGNDVDTGDTGDGNGDTNGTGDGAQTDPLDAASSGDDGGADEAGGPSRDPAASDDDPGAGIAQSAPEQEGEEPEEDEESEQGEDESEQDGEEPEDEEDEEEPDDEDQDESTLLDVLLS